MATYKQAALITGLTVLLAACGGGGSSPSTGPLTLSVTDNPIDPSAIQDVCVAFAGITVHYASQPEVVLDYSPLPSQVTSDTHCRVDTVWNGMPPVPAVKLNALGGRLTAALVESLKIPVGRVTWIRLQFASGASYVLDSMGQQYDLQCPSCDVTNNNDGRGFKLNRTFEVTSAGLALTVDIDLLKSLHQDNTGYVLRPTARIEPDNTLGTIAGSVTDMVISNRGGMLYDGTNVETGCAAYVFEGDGTTPNDYYDGSPAYATARVKYDMSDPANPAYRYAAGALPAGAYTVAVTCDPDDPTVDEPNVPTPGQNAVLFTGGQNTTVVAGQTAEVVF
jgi:Domain of unknown function (DUF4382)